MNDFKAMLNNKKRNAYFVIIVIVTAATVFFSCFSEKKQSKYRVDFFDLFDTYSIIIGYAESKNEYKNFSNIIYEDLEYLHEQFNIYNDFENVNNLKTINDNAGISPVKVSSEILDLLKKSKKAYYITDGYVNVAMGPVLEIWHEHREKSTKDPKNASIPTSDELSKASKLTEIEDLIIDEEAQTVFLRKKGMSLDVGAIGKGYAADHAINKAKEAGMTSVLLNLGGNIVSVGKPEDGKRDRWGLGIQNPKESVNGSNAVFDTVFLNDASVVTSGDYQRFFNVDGVRYNHIIDPKTLTSAQNFSAVTIIHKNSFIADLLSTTVFIMSLEDGKKIVEKYGAEALWIFKDGKSEATDGYKEVSKLYSNFGQK